MADFDTLLAEYTSKENPKVHGVICKCVDKTGAEIYSKVAGHHSISPSSPPLDPSAVLKVASATKIITSIALLQCVEQKLIGLDEPITTILPEFKHKEILTSVFPSGEMTFEKSTIPITARHLLSHTSGLGYRFTHQLLRLRAETHKLTPIPYKVTERYSMPLVFNPGSGWLYGCSLDWAGIAISRLHGGISLSDYFVENIWKKLNLPPPYPVFNISRHPEYDVRCMGGAQFNSKEGKLEPCDKWAFDNTVDQEGGSGLACTADDYLAVLADLISDTPVLLSTATIEEMFTPQLPTSLSSPAIQQLLGLRGAWDTVTGPIAEDGVNHGLGGLLCTKGVEALGQPGDMLCWGGASNVVWWVNRRVGVAGFFATQQAPFGGGAVTEVINAWKKDFWGVFNGREREV